MFGFLLDEVAEFSLWNYICDETPIESLLRGQFTSTQEHFVCLLNKVQKKSIVRKQTSESCKLCALGQYRHFFSKENWTIHTLIKEKRRQKGMQRGNLQLSLESKSTLEA